MTTTQVVETSVTVNNNNSPIQDYVHPHNHTQPTNEMAPWFKPLTILIKFLWKLTLYYYTIILKLTPKTMFLYFSSWN